jgi:DNA-binding NarL/FixJ family response regulator
MSSAKPLLVDDDRSVPPLRTLVVDDYAPFRRFICSTLEKRLRLQIVGEASDGLEAVRKVEELQPDLIVLDIGLPKLNGFEVARRIRKLCPKSEILFVSQESSADVAQEGLSLGARGYVVKARAGSELLAAVEAVCQGRHFISSGLSGRREANEAQAPDHARHYEILPSLVSMNAEVSRSHEVEFYSDDAAFLVGFSRFIESALLTGKAVIVASTESHQKSLLEKLREHGINVGAAIEQGRYLPLDVAEILPTFMVNDLPDPVRFLSVVGDLIVAASRATGGKQSRVAICGESASILWAKGKADAAIQVEQLCNQLTERYGMEILCGFSLSDFFREEDKQIFRRICSESEPSSAR